MFRMARLNEQNDSDEEFPELSTILQPHRSPTKIHGEIFRKEQENKAMNQSQDEDNVCHKKLTQIRISSPIAGDYKITSKKNKTRGQRPLKLVHVNSLLLPIFSTENQRQTSTPGIKDRQRARTNEVKSSENESSYSSILDQISESEDHLSDFIADDSASDIEDVPIKSSRILIEQSRRRIKLKTQNFHRTSGRAAIDLTSPDRPTSTDTFTKHNIKDGLPKDFRVPGIYLDGNPNLHLRL